MSIVGAPGSYVAITPASGAAVTINTASATDKVILRNLHLEGNGAGAGGVGIQVSNGTVIVRDCEITRFGKGVFVTTGTVELENNTLAYNTVAIRAEGQGPDQDSSDGITPRVTIVRVNFGLIADNNTAFEMHNAGAAGTRSQGSCNAQNIFVKNSQTQTNHHLNVVGNPTYLTVTGASDINAGCSGTVAIGTYGTQAQNGTSPANQ